MDFLRFLNKINSTLHVHMIWKYFDQRSKSEVKASLSKPGLLELQFEHTEGREIQDAAVVWAYQLITTKWHVIIALHLEYYLTSILTCFVTCILAYHAFNMLTRFLIIYLTYILTYLTCMLTLYLTHIGGHICLTYFQTFYLTYCLNILYHIFLT